MHIYNSSCSRVRLKNHLSELFEVTKGVLQGDTRAPFLFVIVLDYSLWKIAANYSFTTKQDPYHDLSDLDFADDIALLDEWTMRASSHITALAKLASRVGLQVNMDNS